MNKQERNIEDVITLNEVEDIVDIFLDISCKSNKTVALIANKELISYALEKALQEAWISVKKVDFELEDIEYIISIDHGRNTVVQPVEYYNDKYFSAIQHAFISMDGDVQQITIDHFLDKDIPIVLFGCEDEYDENYTANGKSITKETGNKYVAQFKGTDKNFNNGTITYIINDKKVNKEVYDKCAKQLYDINLNNMGDILLRYKEFIDEMNEWRRLLRF